MHTHVSITLAGAPHVRTMGDVLKMVLDTYVNVNRAGLEHFAKRKTIVLRIPVKTTEPVKMEIPPFIACVPTTGLENVVSFMTFAILIPVEMAVFVKTCRVHIFATVHKVGRGKIVMYLTTVIIYRA